MPVKSILLIEYEASLAEVLRTSLSVFSGWKITLSSSIQEGIQLCNLFTPDAIMLDTSTSEADALLFIEQLKQHSMTKSIPIVLITGRANWFDARQLNQMGFTGAITKPFDPSTLSAQVAQLLGWSNGD